MSRAECAWIECDEVFEGYVRDALTPEDRDAFEAHYFECAACAGKLETCQALQAELATLPAEAPAPGPTLGWPWRWVLAPLGASLVLVAVATWWFRSAAPAVPEATVASAPAAQPPLAAHPAEPPEPEQVPQAVTQQVPASKSTPQPVSPPAVPLSVLARVDPPPYVPLTLRGQHDEAAEKFDAAMRLYTGGDYAGAIPGLRAAAELRPDAAQTLFFLAACHLLTGDVDAAAAGLERTIALGDSPYLEEAHFYLAKARLSQGRRPAAREELRRAIALHGRLEHDGRRLLGQIESIHAGKDHLPDK